MISKCIRGVLLSVVLAAAGFAWADHAIGAVIEVGDHTLDADTAGQTIEIEVSDGGQLIDGINLLADIGEGSTGPTFEDVDLLTGTIFESEGGTQNGSRGDRFVDFSLVTENGTDVTLSDDPEALAMLTIDTSGLSDGRYALNLSDVEISGNVGDTELVHDGSASVPTINDGSIAIGETPTVTWTGGGEDAATTTGANWDGFASPRDGDAVVFAGGTDTTVQNDAEGGITLDSVTFDGSADSFTLQGNGITIADGGAVTNDSANAQTIDLNVASSSPMTFDAASGDLTFSGGVAINDGTLTVTGSNNTTINSGVTGNGSVDKTGGGTLVLDGAADVSDLKLSAGTLRVDPNADLAQDVGLELAGGTFVNNIGQQANADQALTVSGDVAIDSGDAGIEFSGDTDLAGATRSIELLNASEGAFTEFSGSISNGGLELHGTGDETAVLSGNNTYGGGTTLENVTLGVGSDSALGSGAVDVNGTVTVAALDGAREISNTIQLNSTLAVAEDPDGAQDLTLSGGLTLNADSTLRAASSAASTVSGSVDLGSHTLSVEGAEDLTVSGNVSGSGGVTKADGGTLTLSGTNTYGGGTTVEAGTLAVTGSTGGNATVNGGELDLNGGDLGGDATINAGSLTLNNGGSVGGAATVHSGATLSGTGSLGDLNGTGGTISPGHSIGTLSVSGDADLDADTVLDLEVSLDGGTSADLLDVGGQATLADGMALDVSQTGAGTFSGGETFDVLTADGGLSVDPSSLAINSAVDDVGFNAQLSGSTLQLTAELLDLATWTGGADPDGSWSTAGNWENDELPEDGDRLFFAGSTNLDTNNDLAGLTAADITFEQGAGAFTLDGQGLTLESGAAITNESASAQMIDLALTADGALTVDAAAGDLNINGAVSLGNQDLTVTGSHDTSLNGRISGSGGLVKTGDGALTLTTTNTYTGDTTVVGGELDIRGSVTSDVTLNAGRLTLGNGSAIDAANTLTLNGGTLTATGVTIGNDVTVGGDFAVDSGDSLTLDGAVGLGSADRTLTVAGGGTDLTISGDVSGDAALTKAGAGSLTLSGTNSFGDLAVGGGSVSLNGGSALADDAALTLADASGASVTLGADEAIGTLSGGGDSGGDLDLDGNQLTVNQAEDAAFAGQISSSTLGGTLVKQGEGRLTLDGTSTYTGGTTVEAGTLGVTNDEAIGTGELALAGGDIAAIGAEVTLDESVSVMSDFAVEDGGGALSLSGSIDLNGGMRTITLNDPDGTELAGNIANGGLTLTGGESGASVVLSGANTFSGGATLQNVTAGLGHDDALGDGGGVNLDGATLVARNGARTIDESVSLDGDATIAGAEDGPHDLTLSGDWTVTGDRTLTVLSEASNEIAGGVDLQANTLTLALQSDLTVSGVIGDDGMDNGSLLKIGEGTLTLTGANTYGGGTTVNAGTLAVGDDAALGTGSLTLRDATLRADGSARTLANALTLGGDAVFEGEDLTFTGGVDLGDETRMLMVSNAATEFAGAVTGSGGLAKAGDGTLTLSGSNTFGGDVNVSAGTLRAEGGAALPDSGGLAVADGAMFDVGDDETIGSLMGGGTIELNGNTLTSIVPSGLEATPTFEGDANTGTLVKGGDGEFMLTGTVDGLRVEAGQMSVVHQAGDAIDDDAVPEVNATLSLGTSETVAGLTDDSNGNGAVEIGEGATLTLELDQGDQTYTGSITGAGGLTKTGPDTQTLVGDNNDYTGETVVEAGTLVLEGGGAVGDGSDVTVASVDTLELSSAGEAGANSETVGTLAGDGTVQLNDNTLTLAGDGEATFSGTIADGGAGGGLTLDLAEGGQQNFTGTFNFSGELAVDGGTVSFGENMTLPGPFDNSGNTTVNGTIAGGASNSGRLSGNFTVEGNLLNLDGGTVSPGNSIGTTTVNGNYTQEEGSTLEVEISGSTDEEGTEADLLDVNAGNGEDGTATFESGSAIAVSLVEDGNEVQDQDTFDIVDAEGGIMTPEGGLEEIDISEDFALVDFLLQTADGESDNELLQLLAEVADFTELASEFGADRDQRAVAGALNSLAEADSEHPLVQGVRDTVDEENPKRFLAALDEASPQAFEPSRLVAVENARLFSAALGRYFSARRRGTPALAMQGEVSPAGGGGGPLLASSNADPRLLAAAMDEGNGNGGSGPIPAPSGERRTGGEGAPKLFGDSDWSAFARGLGIFQNQDTTDDRLGYRADAGGGLFGIDRQITPDLTAGLSLGYIRTDAELAQNRGEHGIDTVRVGPYLSYSPERWFFDGSMTYGFHHFDSDRSTPASGGDAESEHDGHDLLAQGRVGYDFKVYSTELTLTPEGSLQYLYLYEEAFTERGPGALEVDSRDSHSLRSRLGFSLSYAFESSAVTLVPELFAGWEREYLGDDESIEARFVGGGDAFSVGVGDPEEDSAAVSAGVTALLSEDFSAFARYDGNYSSGGEIHGVTGGIRISF